MEPRSKEITTPQRVALYLAHAFAIASVVMVIKWATSDNTDEKFLGGLNWTDKVFNWHPLYMIVGMVFFYTEALLAYRALPFGKQMNKLFHGFLHVMAMICVIVGLVAVFKSHNYKNSGGYIANLYSMHSWLGLATILLFGQNYFMGLLHFFMPSCAQEARAAYLPSHVFLGIFTYFCAAFTVISGITEKNAFMACGYAVTDADMNPAEHYEEKLPDGCKLSNGIGLVVLLTCLTATYAVMDLKVGSSRQPMASKVDLP